MKVIACGDIHYRFGYLNELINKKQPDVLVQCGDNAYFWLGKQAVGAIKPQKTRIYLILGNHEDWSMIDALGRHGREPIEVEPNIFYCPIGSVLDLNGSRVMFAGGSESIDKAWRTEYVDWFRQETLSYEDVEYCLSYSQKIDIMFTHTCPSLFHVAQKLKKFDHGWDPTMKALDTLLEQMQPSIWYFGHWHAFTQGRTMGCRWYGLNEVPHDHWWMNVIF